MFMFKMEKNFFYFRRFYDSDVDREIEVFHFLVKSLLEEYNSCLPLKPNRELFIIAEEFKLC